MEPGYINIQSDEKLLHNNHKYRKATEVLLYLATISRPDISAAVNLLCRRNEHPREVD